MEKQVDIKVAIRKAKEKFLSPYKIAETCGMSIGELLDKVNEDKDIQKEYSNYLLVYKDFLLTWSRAEKQKDLYMLLLEDAGVLTIDGGGNDLELNIVIESSDKLNIEDITKDK